MWKVFVASQAFKCYTCHKANTYFSIAWADSTWRAVYIIYFIFSFQIIPESLAFKIQLYFNLILL
nr:MAG TPA: Photosynthetic reaction center cytochrome c photosynthesis, Light-harvesting complex, PHOTOSYNTHESIS [Bacteriophage sp.]